MLIKAFKEINHPFYFIHYKDKELLIVGTPRFLFD
jgi:hypothetical protein